MPVIEAPQMPPPDDQSTNDAQPRDPMAELAARMKALVKDAKVDLDEPIVGDVAL